MSDSDKQIASEEKMDDEHIEIHKEEVLVRQIMKRIEHKIPDMNNKAINDMVGPIRLEDFETLAETIAIMRAKYLKNIIQTARTNPLELTEQHFIDSKKSRVAFEEAIASFNQLKRALKRGHFKLEN